MNILTAKVEGDIAEGIFPISLTQSRHSLMTTLNGIWILEEQVESSLRLARPLAPFGPGTIPPLAHWETRF